MSLDSRQAPDHLSHVMDPNRRIQVLPDVVINKIAAGEVVDRPASVLKELVENAIDAGARHIEVELVAGGRTLISVADDGVGMSRDDAILSVERHATSKIRDVHDIENVATLGFRGEALAAIASVSRFTLATRQADAAEGVEITMSGGRILDVKPVGAPPGTCITVRNLFFNVPARRKFLRTEATELSHARHVFLLYAISRPDLGLVFKADGREVHRLSGGSSLEERIRQLFGAELAPAMRALDRAREGIRVHGLASLPQVTRGDRGDQYVFVNGRPAGAPVIGHAIGEAYQAMVPRGRHPVLFLFLELPSDRVDVNVHPTKKEVRFRDPGDVRDAVIEGLRMALAMGATQGATSLGDSPVRDLMEAGRVTRALEVPDLPSLPAFAYPRMPPPDMSGVVPSSSAPPSRTTEIQPQAAAAAAPWSWCRILGQVGGLYVVLETEDGIILMDPHAAHERVLYERFLAQTLGRDVKSQGLLHPETVDLPPARAEVVRRNLDLLRHMGFGIAEFGGETFLVDALPTCLANSPARLVVGDVAETLEAGGVRGGTERWAEEQVARAACKAAVKAQDRLTVKEIEGLVLDLAKAEMPYTCPHGRPTLIFMGFAELRRKFGRE